MNKSNFQILRNRRRFLLLPEHLQSRRHVDASGDKLCWTEELPGFWPFPRRRSGWGHTVWGKLWCDEKLWSDENLQQWKWLRLPIPIESDMSRNVARNMSFVVMFSVVYVCLPAVPWRPSPRHAKTCSTWTSLYSPPTPTLDTFKKRVVGIWMRCLLVVTVNYQTDLYHHDGDSVFRVSGLFFAVCNPG